MPTQSSQAQRANSTSDRPFVQSRDIFEPFSQMPRSPAGPVSACKPYREFIEEQLSRGRNVKAIWQDLVTELQTTVIPATTKR